MSLDQPAGQHPFQLRGKEKDATCLGIVERLNTEAISGQEKTTAIRCPSSIVRSLRSTVINGECKHAPETVQTGFTPLGIGCQNHFGVRGGVEDVAQFLQLGPNLGKVVCLAIVGDPIAPVIVGHGLVTGGGEINDGQPPVPQGNLVGFIEIDAPVIRPAMRHGRGHGLDAWLVRQPKYAGYTTHFLIAPLYSTIDVVLQMAFIAHPVAVWPRCVRLALVPHQKEKQGNRSDQTPCSLPILAH